VTGQVSPQQLAELALGHARAEGTVVLVEETSTANLRWANNTLTTNGVAADRRVTVISTVDGARGTAAAAVTQAGIDTHTLEALVRASEQAARDAGPAPDARPLLGPDAAPALHGVRWDEAAAATDIEVFTGLAPALGQAFDGARSAGQLLFGFAEHTVVSTYLASSTGLRLRHDQPTGKLELNAKSPDFARSAWGGVPTRDFADVDVVALAGELGRRLDWQKRKIDLPAGRYATLLPATAVADLMIYLYWTAAARDAADGRTVFSAAGTPSGTKVGRRLGVPGVRLWSDPSAAGIECAPFAQATASSAHGSVFDNGLPLTSTDWIRDGVLEHLMTTRQSAEETGLPVAAPIDNLLLDAGGSGTLEDLTRSTEDGLLLTCLWYIREVDPQTLLLTGLTRDGVYRVEGGEVTGVVNNFRFNESPVDILNRITAAGATGNCLPREWNDFFTRTSMPALRIADFNMSSVSKAS
jgi:predicted Zn-dependent protease